MTEGSADPQILAWAAGLYDGEGSCSAYLPKKRRTYRRQMAVSQGGEQGHPPEVLTRFKSAVLDVGNITGPYRGYLYYWKTSRKDALDQIASLLWPYLGEVKRSQFAAARLLVTRGPTMVTTRSRGPARCSSFGRPGSSTARVRSARIKIHALAAIER